MPERRVTVAAPEGLHARPAAVFVKAATATGAAVTIARPEGGTAADARSLLSVLALDVRHGEEVVLRTDCTGPESVAALDLLAALLSAPPAPPEPPAAHTSPASSPPAAPAVPTSPASPPAAPEGGDG